MLTKQKETQHILSHLNAHQHLPNVLRTSVLAIIFTSLSHFSYALTTEADLDRFLLAAKKYMAAENYDRARYYLDRASQLNIEHPAEYHFLLGETLAMEGDVTKARQAYEAYVNTTGREGEYYIVSLEKITELEEIELSREVVRQAFSDNNQDKQLLIQSGAVNGSQQEYLETLKKLYITDSHREALTHHINTLFSNSPFVGEKIQNFNKPLLSYKLSISSNNEIILSIKDHREEQLKITSERVNIYGKDPFITYTCDNMKGQCWIKGLDRDDPWLMIGAHEDNAAELARALTKLIQILQTTN